MAEQTVLVELKVSSEEAVKNIDEAKTGLEQLKQQKEELDKTDADYYKKKAQYAEQEQQYKNIIKANTDAIKQNVREQKSNKDSLVAMRAELKKMTTAYDNLSKAEREGAAGQELQQKIRVLTADITHAEEATGRFQRNVGNYRGSIISAFTQIGAAAGGPMARGIQGATNGLKAMSATPIIFILGTLLSVLSKVVGALKNNEAAFDRVKVAMSAFSGVGKVVQSVIGAIGEGIAWLTEKLAALLSKVTMAKDALAEEQELNKQEIDLRNRRRKLDVENARDEEKISELKLKSLQKEKYTAKEREGFIQQAVKLEEGIFNRRLKLATDEYNYNKRRADQAPNSTKDNEKLLASEVELLNIRKEHNDKLASLTKKENSFATQIQATAKATDEAAEAMKKFNDEIDKRATKLSLQVENAAKAARVIEGDELKALTLELQGYEAILNDLTQKQGETSEEFKARYLSAEEAVRNAREKTAEYIQKLNDQQVAEDIKRDQEARKKEQEQEELRKKAADELRDAYLSAANSIADAFGNLSSVFAQFAADSKGAAIAEAGMNMAQITITQALAIAEAIKSAMTTPFPGNIAAVAASVATVAGAMASVVAGAKKAQESISKFATGGYISGPGTGTSDSIPAMLSNGESVINARSTRMFYPLLSAINEAGGGVAFGKANVSGRYAVGGTVTTDALSGSFRTSQMEGVLSAIASMQPVVSVREITKAQNRVSIKEAISRQ